MKTDIDTLIQRTRRYGLSDGLAEVSIGILFLLLGLFFLATLALTSGPLQAILLPLGIPLVVIVAGRLLGKVTRRLRERWTYPRTGYVTYQNSSRTRRWHAIGIGSLVTLVTLAIMILIGPKSQAWMSLLDGILLGFVFLWISQGLRRFYLLSAFAFASGLILALNRIGGNLGHGLFYSISGLALLLSGGLTFWAYLRNNQLAGEELP
jgi:hypothetical protein